MSCTEKNIQTNDVLNYYLTVNINNICRVCLEKGPKLMPIFDPVKPPHFSVLLMACAQIQVHEKDGLPPYICQRCVSKLNIAFQFKTMCESSDVKLRQCVENLNNLQPPPDFSAFIDLKKEESITFSQANADKATNSKQHAAQTDQSEATFEDTAAHGPTPVEMESQTQQNNNQPQAHNIFDSEPNIPEINKDPLCLDLKFDLSDLKHMTIDSLKVEELSITPTQKENSKKSTKQHICDTCGKIFKTKPSLVHHIRIHTGERPYVCHLCDKRFINGGHLHTHMRTHTGEKNHVCVACSKAFATAQQLTKHTIAIHTSERPYACTYCSKRFASSSNLSTHIRIHTGEKNYHCDQCGKAFSTKGQLYQHMLVHTGEKAFLCEFCMKRFSQKAHLIRHSKTHKT